MIDVPTRVKDALRDGRRLKEYRFVVLKSDGTTDFTIDNDYLVKESVKFDERMVTGKELKFGLCEGSSLEFQYFNKPNINGKQIQAFIDVQYKDSDNTLKWYTIPMGWFTVDQCPMQFSTGIYKVTAYNKLKSEYLDAPANESIIELVDEGELGLSDSLSYYKLLEELLEGYKISTLNKSTAAASTSSSVTSHNNISVDWYSLGITSMLLWYDGTPLRMGEYYNIRINAKAIFDEIVDRLNYKNTYVMVDGVRMSVYDYCFSNVWGAGRFGGGITIAVNQVQVKHYDFSKYTRDTGESIIETGFITSPNYQLEVDVTLPSIDYDHYFELGTPEVDHLILGDIDKQRVSLNTVESFANVTIRDLQSAVFEIDCQYGKLDRTTDLFSGIELNQSFLYPADNLYPSDTLYPSGIAESSFKSQYSKLWTDMVGEQSFRNLIITYKGTIVDPDTQQTSEGDKTITKVVNASGTTDYIMDNNWLFKNLLWADQDVEDYADAMVLKMQSIKWFPFEMWGAGLPYIESGDMIEISDREGNTYTTYILQRQLEGIQNLQDTYINGELDIF